MKDGGLLCGSILPFILGALLICLGVISCYYPHHVFLLHNSLYYNIFFIKFGLFSLDKIFIAVGVFICFNSLFCCDSCSKTFLNCIILIIFFVCIGIMSTSIINYSKESMSYKIGQSMMEKVESFDNKTEESFLNVIQQELQCCGVSNRSDWTSNTLYKTGSVPDSCCKNISLLCGESADPDDIHEKTGCLLKLEEQVSYYTTMVLVIIVLCVTTFLTILFALCNCCGV